MSEGEMDSIPCVFFTYQLDTGLVTETLRELPYRYLRSIRICYDGSNDHWGVGINARVRAFPNEKNSYSIPIRDLYHIQQGAWSPAFRMPKRKSDNESLSLLTLWPPLDGEGYRGLMRESWTLAVNTILFRYTCTSHNEVLLQLLERGFVFVPFVFDQTFLIFCCDFRQKTAQWGWKVTAYQNKGSRLRRKRIPDIAYHSRYEDPFTIDDMQDWLHPQCFVSQGPVVKETGLQTCVAAIFLQECPLKWWRSDVIEAVQDPDMLSCQGGLYCFDEQGRTIARDVTPLGEHIHLCPCDEEIIGTDRWDHQSRLWSWSPLQQKKWELRAILSPTVTRVSLAGMAPGTGQRAGHFWSVEEDPTGITVSLWRREPFEVQEQMRMDNVFLPTHRSQTGPGQHPCGLWTYRERLAVLVMEHDGHLQLVEFYSENIEQQMKICSSK